jgi:hypothetical protein
MLPSSSQALQPGSKSDSRVSKEDLRPVQEAGSELFGKSPACSLALSKALTRGGILKRFPEGYDSSARVWSGVSQCPPFRSGLLLKTR